MEKEVIIKADKLQHTYIVNCKNLYSTGEYLKVKIKDINIQKNIFNLSGKDFLENPFKNIRKYITENRK